MKEIEKRIKSILIDKLGIDEAEVKLESEFSNDLGADSLDTVEIIMEIEKEFEIQIPDEDAKKIKTFGEAVNYITEHKK